MDGDLSEVWKALNDFKLEYERRHGQLSGDLFGAISEVSTRVTRLEEVLKNAATREDVTKMDGIVARFEETLGKFQAMQMTLATKADVVEVCTDVKWLQKLFWAAVALMTGIDLAIITAIIKVIFKI